MGEAATEAVKQAAQTGGFIGIMFLVMAAFLGLLWYSFHKYLMRQADASADRDKAIKELSLSVNKLYTAVTVMNSRPCQRDALRRTRSNDYLET